MAKIEIDWGKLDVALQFNVSLRVCADILGVSQDTIERRIKETHKKTFYEYKDSKMSNTRVRLMSKALEMALSGKNTPMMIFALKNLCGWTDKTELTELSSVDLNKLKEEANSILKDLDEATH